MDNCIDGLVGGGREAILRIPSFVFIVILFSGFIMNRVQIRVIEEVHVV